MKSADDLDAVRKRNMRICKGGDFDLASGNVFDAWSLNVACAESVCGI